MSWYSKVFWSEGLFLRPHHLQQNDRYLEHLIDKRVRRITPYPWGFDELEIDQDLAQQSKFAVRRASGVLPDGTPFDIPADSPLPDAIDVPEGAAGQIAWLVMPLPAPNTREVDESTADSASRYIRTSETFIDSTSSLRLEEEVEIAVPRLSFELRKTSKPGYMGLGIARVLEVRDKNVLFDERFVPPMLVCAAHPVIDGWLNRIIGWIDAKLEELARYAVDPSSGGGLQSVDYLMLQLLNREIPALIHLQRSGYIHPERLYEQLLRLAGELSTFATTERRARDYPAYDHDDLENVFAPLIRDIQEFLSARLGRAGHPPRNHRAGPERVPITHPRPFALPQRDFRSGSHRSAAAGRNPERFPPPVQGRAQHQDERDRAREPARFAARAPADATAANPCNHRSRVFLSGQEVAALA
ncbi:type VI secretion system protein ImpJ [Bradyrhizobium sp. GM22.5]